MYAFSYAWSLLITWQRWWSCHLICRGQKPHAICKHHGLQSYCRSKYAGIGIFNLFAPMTLTLTRWLIYELDAYSLEIYLMNKYEHQGFRKLSSNTYIQTDTTEVIYNAASQVVRNNTCTWNTQKTQKLALAKTNIKLQFLQNPDLVTFYDVQNPWFSHLSWQFARKWTGPILTTPEPDTGQLHRELNC